jgi:hypothetical protein
MTPAENIRDAANTIKLATDLFSSVLHERCMKIQQALADCGYTTEGALSETQLQAAADELEAYGKSIIWLSKAVAKQRFDLLQAGHNVTPLRAAE